MDRLGQWFWYANLLALAVLLIRMKITGLYPTCRFLFGYFLGALVWSFSLTRISLYSNSYAIVYMGGQALIHVLAILAVLELYGIALAKHPGLASFGRASVLVVTFLTILLAAAGTLLDMDVLSGQSAVLHRFFTLERTLEFVIFLFALLIAAFITWFPVNPSRNIGISIGGFAVFYLTRAAGLLAVNVLPHSRFPAVNNALLAFSFLCASIWALLLRPEEVASEVETPRLGDSTRLDRLGHQLDTINSALLRFGRR